MFWGSSKLTFLKRNMAGNAINDSIVSLALLRI
jgi:hypothetical protein